MDKSLLREFLIGFVRIHVLHHASKGGFYGNWMIEELREHGYKLSPGTIYPILHRMEEKGLLVSEIKREGKVARKFYQTTKLGNETLDALKDYICELKNEITN